MLQNTSIKATEKAKRSSRARGGVRVGGSPPATTIHYYNQKAKRSSGARGGSPLATTIHYYNREAEALERRTGGVRGGGSPPATTNIKHHFTINFNLHQGVITRIIH